MDVVVVASFVLRMLGFCFMGRERREQRRAEERERRGSGEREGEGEDGERETEGEKELRNILSCAPKLEGASLLKQEVWKFLEK